MRDPDINEVARRSGVPAPAMRYYEEKGLIDSAGRRGLPVCSIPMCWSGWR